MTDDARAVQEKLLAKRKALLEAEDPDFADGPDRVEFQKVATIDGWCSRCGEATELTVVNSPNGETASTGLCPECYKVERKRNLPPPPPPEDQETPAAKVKRVLSGMDSIGINVRRHGHLRLEDLEEGDPRRASQVFVQDVLKAGEYKEVSGLYLHGITGTGKSQLAVSVVRALMEQGMNPKQIVYDRGRAMITQLQDCYGNNSVDAFSEKRRRCRLWVYEDAGTEKGTADAFRVMEDIFDRREGHPTIVTSNLKRKALAERWKDFPGWERFLSRLAPFRSAECLGTDKRFS
jgi:chromosomal replication initiation ATPase DnaA